MTAAAKLPETSGESVGRYRLCFELASGGMATVFLARSPAQHGFTKVVALKRIHKHLSKHEDYVEMFLDEARIASRIDHPNVCHVLDFGEADGEYFMTMEYLVAEGLYGVLKQLVRHPERVSIEEWMPVAIKAIVEAAEGLHAAHELTDANGEPLGIVHRDVSPQNLMLGYDGVLRVVDFGIAKAEDRLHETVTGEVKGKWSYMSPEQARAQRGAVDRRTDVWALGVVLWEMLTLRRLFKRPTSADTIYSVLEDEIHPPSRHRPEVPAAVDAVVIRALNRNRETRYPTTRAFAEALLKAFERPATAKTASDVMQRLFPEQKALKRQMIEIARVSQSIVPARLPARPDTGSFSGIAETLAARGERSGDPVLPVNRSSWFVGAVLLVAGGLGAGWALFGSSEQPRELLAAADTSEPAALEDAVEERVLPNPEPAEEPAEVPVVEAEDPEVEALGDPTDEPTGEAEEPEGSTTMATMRRRPNMRRTDMSMSMQSMMEAVVMDPVVMEPVMQATATGPGTLVVTTPGTWANVFLAGRLLGPTPLRRPLPPGDHQLHLRFEGQPPSIPVRATIRSGEATRVRRSP